ncbi:MAG: TetR/AcrR family transcriptional regulator [Deltaproteobacteria bacterium]|nr:TetR/AcrR family transcriptional regulator [Deltaproteobacteria bacterium]
MVQADQHKRELILQAALEVFVEKGFRGASTAEISLRAGVATGSLFYHFSSKKALYETLYKTVRQQFFDNLFSEVEQTHGFQERLKKLWFAASRWSIANQSHYTFLKTFEAIPAFSYSIGPSVEANSELFRQLFHDGVNFQISSVQWQLLSHLVIGMHEGFIRLMLSDVAVQNQEEWWHTSYMMCWQAVRVALPNAV